MTLNHQRPRNRWAQHHQTRALRHWRHVMFSDESRFYLRFTDGRKRVWRRRGERYVKATIMEHDSYGGGSVMVWGGITYDRRTDLIVIRGNMTGQRYVNEILRPVVAPMANRIRQNFVFKMTMHVHTGHVLLLTSSHSKASIHFPGQPNLLTCPLLNICGMF